MIEDVSQLTINQKKQLLCMFAAEAEEDDGDMYALLWNGLPGYKDSTDEEIEKEWDEMFEGMSNDEIWDEVEEKLPHLT